MSVTVQGLRKSFTTESGQVRAVRDLDLSVKAGEFFSLLGPSGCGKTTTVRCIAGLETPEAGDISLGAELVYSSRLRRVLPANRRSIGMVFQSYAVWPHMTVYENIAYPLRYGSPKKLSSSEIQTKVSHMCQVVQLQGLESRSATTLSGGQQQRVALARALVREPEVVLLDEPLSNLDAKLRIETRLELRKLIKAAGATAVYVTHDQAEAFAVSDRIAVMREGRIVQIGTAQEIYSRPNGPFVAEFVGRINVVSGVVRSRSAGASSSIVVTDFGPLVVFGVDEIAERTRVQLGIRAENVLLAAGDCAGAENSYPASVDSVTFLGDSLEYQLRIGEVVFVAKAPPGANFAPGDDVVAELPARSWVSLGQPSGGA